jgi:uncharacterized membrane protein YkvA (DUF1232 family)
MKMALEVWRQRARHLKRETYALALVARDARVPWYTKALALALVGYALSPLDLIPDFVPIFGFVDDLIVVPLGIVLLLRLTPSAVLADCRAQAQNAIENGRLARSLPARLATAAIVLAWILGLMVSALVLVRLFTH